MQQHHFSIFVIFKVFFTARRGFANIIFATESTAPNWKRRFCQESEYGIFVCVFCAALCFGPKKCFFVSTEKHFCRALSPSKRLSSRSATQHMPSRFFLHVQIALQVESWLGICMFSLSYQKSLSFSSWKNTFHCSSDHFRNISYNYRYSLKVKQSFVTSKVLQSLNNIASFALRSYELQKKFGQICSRVLAFGNIPIFCTIFC